MAFSVGQLNFIDSFQFTMNSLDNLASTLDDHDLKHTRKIFEDDEEFYLMRKKGVFPYDFLDNLSKLTSNKPIDFPRRHVFYNKKESQECSMKVCFIF